MFVQVHLYSSYTTLLVLSINCFMLKTYTPGHTSLTSCHWHKVCKSNSGVLQCVCRSNNVVTFHRLLDCTSCVRCVYICAWYSVCSGTSACYESYFLLSTHMGHLTVISGHLQSAETRVNSNDSKILCDCRLQVCKQSEKP